MSRRTRTREHFPRMKERGGRRRHFQRRTQQLELLYLVPMIMAQAAEAYAAAVDAFVALSRAYDAHSDVESVS